MDVYLWPRASAVGQVPQAVWAHQWPGNGSAADRPPEHLPFPILFAEPPDWSEGLYLGVYSPVAQDYALTFAPADPAGGSGLLGDLLVLVLLGLGIVAGVKYWMSLRWRRRLRQQIYILESSSELSEWFPSDGDDALGDQSDEDPCAVPSAGDEHCPQPHGSNPVLFMGSVPQDIQVEPAAVPGPDRARTPVATSLPP
uniref:Uncharacterized protein n=1 Tax=Eutreptiella gymnastica TaxID=73025 RepID=A0A7S1IG09_9EUGL